MTFQAFLSTADSEMKWTDGIQQNVAEFSAWYPEMSGTWPRSWKQVKFDTESPPEMEKLSF